MQQYSTYHPFESSLEAALSANSEYYNIINRWLHLFVYDNYPNSVPMIPGSLYTDLYEFTLSAEDLLKNHSEHSHVMLVINCIAQNISTDNGVQHGLVNYLNNLLQDHIHTPHLSCQMDDHTFTILLEDCKEIDISVLVIYLTELISGYHPQLKSKLTFGICKADRSERDVQALYQKAYCAMTSIKEQDQQLLADYHELMVKTAAQG